MHNITLYTIMPPSHYNPERLHHLLPSERDPLHGDDRYRKRMGFPEGTPISTIHKKYSPSVFRRVSDIAKVLGAYAASKNPYSFENLRDDALDNYQRLHKDATNDDERTAILNEYNAHVEKLRKFFKIVKKGGKNKSRKSRKNRKTRSRKNRKTRSRK